MDVVYIFGLISMLADFVYEGGRSLIPVVLSNYTLAEIGLLSGLSEGLGYILRALSGYVADKLSLHWSMMFLGYLAVSAYPAAALYPVFGTFLAAVVIERVGKAIRSPARDALLAAATDNPGRAFGIVETFDQVGAILGPLTAFALLSAGLEARQSLLFYFVPALALIPLILTLRKLKARTKKKELVWKPSSVVLFSFFIGASFIQPILSIAKAGEGAPLFYAIVMLTDALFAIPLGVLYERRKRLTIGLAIPLAPASLTLYTPYLAPYAGLAIAYMEVVLKAIIAEAGGSGTLYGMAYASLGFGSILGGIIMPTLGPQLLTLYSLGMSTIAVLTLFNKRRFLG